MNSDWQKLKLSDAMKIIGGGTPNTSIPEYWNGDIPWLSVVDFNNDRRWVYTTEKFISKEGYRNSSTKTLKRGQLIISARGTVGLLAQLGKDMAFNQSCYGLDAHKKITSNDYLYYAISSITSDIKRSTHGGIFDTITQHTFDHLFLKFPPLLYQSGVVKVLSALDDKIELNRQMCLTLEMTATTLFKSWFVDFDPVKAKMTGRILQGMDPKLLDLFPNGFNDSELGPIPIGWKVKQLNAEFRLLMGQSPHGKTYNKKQDGIPFFQGTRDFGFRYPSNRVWCSAPKRNANPGDTLVSVRAPVGEVNMAIETVCIGRGVASVRHKTGAQSYTYYCMKSLARKFEVYEAEGTVFGSINKIDFSKMRVLGFNSKILTEFENLCAPLDKNIECLSRQITLLKTMRDKLLPKLISGELRVKDMERV